jgi:hypothetical protein
VCGPLTTLDNFDFTFNKTLNCTLLFELVTCAFIARRKYAPFLGSTSGRF